MNACYTQYISTFAHKVTIDTVVYYRAWHQNSMTMRYFGSR